MAERDYQALIAKYLAGEASHQEEYELRQWVDMDKSHEVQFEAAYASWEAVHRSAETLHPDIDKAWNRLNSRIDATQDSETTTRSLRSSKWLRYAAAIVLLGGIAWLIQWSLQGPETFRYQATDALAQHPLPDQSTVWLQPGSQLTYTEGAERALSLQGTAYFEVQRDEDHPFVIQTGQTEVRVLGTAFTITETDSAVEVLVSSGKVSFSSDAEKVLLEKGVKGTYQVAQGSLDKSPAELYDYLPGQDTYWVFEATPLQKIAAVLGQHYGKEISLQPEAMGNCTFTGSFVEESLADMLKVIALATDAELSPTEKGFALTGKGC